MQRLVYTPRIDAYVKADTGIYDISPYITDFQIDRKIDQVSSAQITFRNPDFMWTRYKHSDPISGKVKIGPVFHPMDPITIMLTRLRNRPIQVFTGYCDTTPYLQLFPGNCNIEASCTLKRLLYTYWDPGLPFVWEFLNQHGWQLSPQGGIANPPAESLRDDQSSGPARDDSGIGKLLFSVLTEVGGWAEQNIYIEKIPDNLFDAISFLFNAQKSESQQASQEFQDLLHQIIGTSSLGTGDPGGGSGTGSAGGAGPAPRSPVTPVDVGRAMLTVGFPSDATVLAQGMAVVNVESTFGENSRAFTPNSASCVGYWQIQYTSHGVSIDDCNDLVKSTKIAHDLWKACGNSFRCDWYNFEGSGSSQAQQYREYLSKAQSAIRLGPFSSTGHTSPQEKIHR